ncbi:MAG: hypothetical protein KQJ78_08405 [Deltaproteobacteria bacterium]|nr:hypothetical protein [Deltaproteobacteria bacterium]
MNKKGFPPTPRFLKKTLVGWLGFFVMGWAPVLLVTFYIQDRHSQMFAGKATDK